MFQPAKPPSLPALRAVVAGQVTPGLYPAFSFVLRRVLESGPNSLEIPQVGQESSPALQSATQPLTAAYTVLLGPAAPGASAVAAALFPVPAPPTSAGSADQSLPVGGSTVYKKLPFLVTPFLVVTLVGSVVIMPRSTNICTYLLTVFSLIPVALPMVL